MDTVLRYDNDKDAFLDDNDREYPYNECLWFRDTTGEWNNEWYIEIDDTEIRVKNDNFTIKKLSCVTDGPYCICCEDRDIAKLGKH